MTASVYVSQLSLVPSVTLVPDGVTPRVTALSVDEGETSLIDSENAHSIPLPESCDHRVDRTSVGRRKLMDNDYVSVKGEIVVHGLLNEV